MKLLIKHKWIAIIINAVLYASMVAISDATNFPLDAAYIGAIAVVLLLSMETMMVDHETGNKKVDAYVMNETKKICLPYENLVFIINRDDKKPSTRITIECATFSDFEAFTSENDYKFRILRDLSNDRVTYNITYR